MNVLVPFFFTLLGIVLGDDGAARIEVSANHDVEYTEALSTDTLTMGDGVAAVRINIYEAVGQVGSRRYMATFDADGHPVDVTDLGKEVDAGFIDELYVTDRRGNTLTVVFTVEAPDFDIAPSPEGGYTIEQADKITARVINHDAGEQTDYVLRHTTIVKHLDTDGHIRLQSIRPTTDDLDAFVANHRVCDTSGEDNHLLDAQALRSLLTRFFPLAR